MFKYCSDELQLHRGTVALLPAWGDRIVRSLSPLGPETGITVRIDAGQQRYNVNAREAN
jgi:hypothetical protein